MSKKLLALACGTLMFAACSEGPTSTQSTPLLDVHRNASSALVPGRYIVLFKGSVADVQGEAGRIVRSEGGRMLFVYEHAVRGFSADLSDAAVERLRRNPSVALIEQDAVVKLEATQAPTPSWGLDRIDQVNLPLNSSYTYPNTGAGVHFYGIDTGILGGINGTATTPHVDIAGRLSSGFDAITVGGTANDCNGHGTHTATTAAGTTYGVAKTMMVHPVRVLNCAGSGTFGQVVAGINWVTADHQAHPGQNSVANMSLGGGLDIATNNAVKASIAAGVVYSLSAGNSFGADACTQSPAAVLEGLTVMAFDITDRLANFSNIGTCTDLGGPGVNITAGWIGSPTAITTISGTSMSAPHVAGVAGLYLAANPGASVATVNTAIINGATNNIIAGVGGGAFPGNSPNKNLNMQFIGGGPVNMPPVANFTSSCAGLTCTFDGTSSSDPDGTIASYLWTRPNGQVLSTAAVFTRTFPQPTTIVLNLTVTDNSGATNTITKTVVIGGTGNLPPVSSFTYTCTAAHACTFNGTGSSDPDGTIASYAWFYNNNTTPLSTAATFSRTFPGARVFNLKLTVTDNLGATNSSTQTINVP